jgi:threonylcarbamoyladenosine tRNA methylthiotransferase MtaB
MKTFAIKTLGCRVNQNESSVLQGELLKKGFKEVAFNEKADFYIINTCTVTAKSDTNARYFIRHARRSNPNAKIIVTGCFVQKDSQDKILLEEADMLVGNAEKLNIADLLFEFDFADSSQTRKIVSDIFEQKIFSDKKVFSPVCTSLGGRTRANIKIQDGCNFRCSYCIVPYVRGKSRSNPLDEVIKQARIIADNGYKELILTGIHSGQWGLDLEPKNNFAGLIKEIEKIANLERYRLSSIDPVEFSDELLETLSRSKKFCRHFHISLQSGCDQILKQMNRRYSVEYYSELIEKINKMFSGIAIGSDIIVGFPGETDEHFEETYQNLKKLPLSYIHVFSYSRREGTPAFEMKNQVKESVKKERNKILTDLAKQKNLTFRKSFINKELEVLIEVQRDRKTKVLKGLSGNYIEVLVDADDKYKNSLVKVKINDVNNLQTYGNIVI